MKTIGPFFIKSLDWMDKFRFSRSGETYTYLGYGEYQSIRGKIFICADGYTFVYLLTTK